ncbi:hypothetical protein CV016_00115 [Yersinia kristensenii]|nr:hypothetical protein CS536_08950 [Yersinia kristensenii]PJE83571.1 hypothetical protein CU276_12700 [Yersinia kristensenii]PJG64477.1 hypothetical protein CV016_00115 [Yersinia kristensenii]
MLTFIGNVQAILFVILNLGRARYPQVLRVRSGFAVLSASKLAATITPESLCYLSMGIYTVFVYFNDDFHSLDVYPKSLELQVGSKWANPDESIHLRSTARK